MSNQPDPWELADEVIGHISNLYPSHGIHGILHPLRLMAMTPEFCHSYNLPVPEFLLAAGFHDTGRTHDEEDEDHGRLALPKLANCYPHKLPLVEDLIANHCRPNPATGFPRELEYFKDLDAIDRQRFGETEIRTFRLGKDLNYWLERNARLQKARTWSEMLELV
jgi:hypothetical protein